MWTISSVKKILKNRMYVGDMVQSVQTKVSYKSNKKKTLPKSNWDIVKNTHEPLVDRFIFESVQNNVKRTNVNKKENSDVNNQINDLRKQEKDLISKLDMLYQDKFNGIVSEEMYLRISRETENSLIKTREKIQNLQDTKEEKKVNKSEIKDYEDKIRKLIDIDNPSRELIQALIDKIIIDKDRNIEIIYKFSILNN